MPSLLDTTFDPFAGVFGSTRGQTQTHQRTGRKHAIWMHWFDDDTSEELDDSEGAIAAAYYCDEIDAGRTEEALKALSLCPQRIEFRNDTWGWKFRNAGIVMDKLISKVTPWYNQHMEELITRLYAEWGLDEAVANSKRSRAKLLEKLVTSGDARTRYYARKTLEEGKPLTMEALTNAPYELWQTKFIDLLAERVYRKNDAVLAHFGLPVAKSTPSEWKAAIRRWLAVQMQYKGMPASEWPNRERAFRAALESDYKNIFYTLHHL